MRIPHVITAVLLSLSSIAAARADLLPDDRLELHEPGQPVGGYMPAGKTTPDRWMRGQRWYSATLDGSVLRIEPITKTTRSDWREVNAAADARPRVTTTRFARAGFTMEQPRGALFAFRVVRGADGVAMTPGEYRSALRGAVLLQDRWQTAFRLRGEAWTLRTQAERRPDGALLAGSMRLVVKSPKGEARELVAPGHGMAFSKQELLWLGDLNADGKPDAILKRTWTTGEMDYVLAVSPTWGTLYVDTDRPYRAFSSGVEDSLNITRHRDQKVPLPAGRFGVAAFSISDAAWNKALGAGGSGPAPALPKLIADRRLELDGEPMRFTFEYVPRAACCTEGAVSSSTEGAFSGGAGVVKVHYRGGSQVLMTVGTLDEAPLRVQVGRIHGKPAIELSHQPHYNNSFSHYWILPEADATRFRRFMVDHSQGC